MGGVGCPIVLQRVSVGGALETAAEVLTAIPAGGVAHFACHAEVEVGKPLDSSVILRSGGRLTVGDILEATTPPAAMVVLSACESGVAGPYVIDEAIGLPAAFLAAGCRSVVSTLWLVEDLSSTLLMLRFYWEWRRQGNPVPLALAQAQHWQRSTPDGEKCTFVETILVEDAAFVAHDGRALADRLRSCSDDPTINSYQEPYTGRSSISPALPATRPRSVRCCRGQPSCLARMGR